MYCIKCEKNNIEILSLKEHENTNDYDSIKMHNDRGLNHVISYNGIVSINTVGYGSIHDGDTLSIGICDECLTKSIKKGTVIMLGTSNDTTPNSSPVENSKKAFTRRSNLDNLLDN